MGIVLLTAFIEEGSIALIVGFIALVEVFGSRGHVDEGNILLLSQLLHLVAEVIAMVILSQLSAVDRTIIGQDLILVAHVMTASTCDGSYTIGKITTADGRYQHGDGTLLLDGIDNLLQTLLIGSVGHGATTILLHSCSISGITYLIIISLQFQIVHSTELRVVVGKLDEHIVASLHIVFGVLPQLGITHTGVASSLGIVH